MSEKSLAVIKTENLELVRENTALKETITQLLHEIQRLRNLEPANRETPLAATPEERIVQTQIEQFDAIAKTRQLTLEEIRAFDLLIKNQKLINENKKPKDVPPAEESDNVVELMRIAGNVEEFVAEPVEAKPRRKQKTSDKNPVD